MNPALLAAVRRIESRGAHSCDVAWMCMSPELAKRLGASSCWVGPAFVSAARRSESVRMNRVVGFGALDAPGLREVREIIDFYRGSGVRKFALSVLETSLSPALRKSLLSQGFKPEGGTTYLVRDVQSPPPGAGRSSRVANRAAPRVRVRRIGRRGAPAWAHIVCSTFGWPPSREPWVAAQVGLPGSEHYLAFLGEIPVATGQIITHGNDVWVGGAATLTKFRRQGAQGALIAHRIRRSEALGCRWLVTETLIPQRGRPQGSYRNLVKEGFVPVVIKRDFVFSAA